MSNKSEGSKFERDLANYLSNIGYWCHLVEGAKYVGSQPFDCICARNNKVWALEIKLLENSTGKFPMSRIEENQRLSYKKFLKCGNMNFFLVVLWNNDIYIKSFSQINFTNKSIDFKKETPLIKEFYRR